MHFCIDMRRGISNLYANYFSKKLACANRNALQIMVNALLHGLLRFCQMWVHAFLHQMRVCIEFVRIILRFAQALS